MQRPARTRLRTRRARVSRNVRGNGFDADAGFTIVEVVVAVDAAARSRSWPRPDCSRRAPASPATPASGWSPPSSRRRRSRRSAARRPTPLGSRPRSCPGQTDHDPDGERPEVHDHPGHAVGRPDRRPRARATAAAPGSNSILQVTESVTWPGAGRDRAGAVDDRARRRRPARTRRRPVRSAPRCSTRPGSRSSTRRCRSPGRRSQTQDDDGRRLRVLRVPDARRVHGVGHRGHRRRRPGGADPEPGDVGDGRPDRVAARSTTTPRRRSPITGWSGSAATPATNIPIGDREHRPAAVRPVLVRGRAPRR